MEGADPARIFSDELLKLKQSGFGAFTHPEIERWIARVLLFSVMNIRYRRRLALLRDSCLPIYTEMFEVGKRLLPHVRGDIPTLPVVGHEGEITGFTTINGWQVLNHATEQHPVAQQLRAGMKTWVAKQNLEAEWVLDAIVKLFCAWRMSPETAERPLFFITGSMSLGRDRRLAVVTGALHCLIYQLAPASDKFSVAAYNPAMQTRKEHTDEVLALLRKHQVQQEQRFGAAGFSVSKPKRPKKRRPWEELDWFLQYQVGGKSGSEIASTVSGSGSITEAAVMSGVREASALLQIQMRLTTSERPKKLERKR